MSSTSTKTPRRLETLSPATALILGQTEYEEAMSLMERLRLSRIAGDAHDHLLFLEHPPVVTIGRRDSEGDLILSKEKLHENRIKLLKTNRGGKLTYHGPGQLVVYFVVDIQKLFLGIDRFVSKVTEGIKEFLAQEGVDTKMECGRPGLYVGPKKIASVGFHIHRSVSSHGAAVNLSCDLTPFSYFHPCGETGGSVTSLLQESGRSTTLREASRRLAGIYSALFGWELSINQESANLFSDEGG